MKSKTVWVWASGSNVAHMKNDTESWCDLDLVGSGLVVSSKSFPERMVACPGCISEYKIYWQKLHQPLGKARSAKSKNEYKAAHKKRYAKRKNWY